MSDTSADGPSSVPLLGFPSPPPQLIPLGPAFVGRAQPPFFFRGLSRLFFPLLVKATDPGCPLSPITWPGQSFVAGFLVLFFFALLGFRFLRFFFPCFFFRSLSQRKNFSPFPSLFFKSVCGRSVSFFLPIPSCSVPLTTGFWVHSCFPPVLPRLPIFPFALD